MSESCVNNMTIFSVIFFFFFFKFPFFLFCGCAEEGNFVWEVGFKCFPLSVFPAPCHNAS